MAVVQLKPVLTLRQEMALKGMIYAYALMVVEETKQESRKELWYLQAVEVKEYFEKRRPTKLENYTKKGMDTLLKELISFDSRFFDGQKMSTYLCMITILDYMVNYAKDTEMRSRFLHFPFKQIEDELRVIKLADIKSIKMTTKKYVTALVERLGIDESVMNTGFIIPKKMIHYEHDVEGDISFIFRSKGKGDFKYFYICLDGEKTGEYIKLSKRELKANIEFYGIEKFDFGGEK